MPAQLLSIIFFFTVSIISAQPELVKANTEVFSEDFEEQSIGAWPEGWIEKRSIQWSNPSNPCIMNGQKAVWKIYDINGSKMAGMEINGPTCQSDLIYPAMNIPDHSNVRYEVDLTYPANILQEKNFGWNYVDVAQWYGLKFVLNNIDFQKVINIEYNHLGKAYYPIASSSGYKTLELMIEILDNWMKVFVNNQLVHTVYDPEPRLSGGVVALQTSSGNPSYNAMYFDNIIVTDLAPTPEPTPSPTPTLSPTPSPTPTPLPYLDVMHQSQRDPLWSEEIYDHRTASASLNTIEDLGCMLTSASMMLNYHGYTQSPNFTPTNPSSLNQYLINNHGYTRQGFVVGPAVAKYTQAARISGATDASLPLLEHTKQIYNTNTLQSLLDQNMPAIIKIVNQFGSHFMVAKGLTDAPNQDIYLNDPWEQTNTSPLLSTKVNYSAPLQIDTYTPSFTDLSFMELYYDQSNVTVEITSEDALLQQYIDEHIYSVWLDPIAAIDDKGAASSGQGLLSLPKPPPGNYIINIISEASQEITGELFQFFHEDPTQVIDFSTYAFKNEPIQLKIQYPMEDGIQREYSFDTLIKLIDAGYNQESISSRSVYLHLRAQTLSAKRVNLYSTKASRTIMNNLSKIVSKKSYIKHMNPDFHFALTQEISGLLSTLNK